MASKAVQMITGANAKIVFDGVVLAFATNVSYRTDIQTLPIEVMGVYEVKANEPIATYVSGSFTVIRYTSGIKANNIVGTEINDESNGVGDWVGTANPAGVTGNASFLNPAQILASKTVDIVLFRKTILANGAQDEVQFKKIHDARLEQVSGTLNKAGVLMETFTFVAEVIQDGIEAEAAATYSTVTDLSLT
jgi:hypothetical protein